jgi:UDP-N-acetyl-D-galactosamine dehydrogenase
MARGWTWLAGLLKDRRGIVLDVKSKLDRDTRPDAVELWRM